METKTHEEQRAACKKFVDEGYNTKAKRKCACCGAYFTKLELRGLLVNNEAIAFNGIFCCSKECWNELEKTRSNPDSIVEWI